MKISDGAEFYYLKGGLSECMLTVVLALELVEILTWMSRIPATALFHELARHKLSLSLLYLKRRSMQHLIAVVITLVCRQNTFQLHSALSVKHNRY
jgi:hypothetical protein